MTDVPHPDNATDTTLMRDLSWSSAEKAIAHQVFDRALQRELEAVITEAKNMAAKVEQPSDLWDLESYLTRRRQEIDCEYDYRYSVLPQVFGNLIRRGLVREEELGGLAEDKLRYVRLYAAL